MNTWGQPHRAGWVLQFALQTSQSGAPQMLDLVCGATCGSRCGPCVRSQSGRQCVAVNSRCRVMVLRAMTDAPGPVKTQLLHP